MANELSIPTTGLPAHIAARMGAGSALGDTVSGGITSGDAVPRISLKGSRFRIVEDGTEEVLDTTFLDVVIVGANPNVTKLWYDKAWSPDAEAEAPACFSLDGERPDSSAEKPQSDLCATCPHNAWGSKVSESGQKIKACPDNKRLAVVSPDDATGTVYLLTVTASVLGALKQYHKELINRGIPPELVITRLSFDTDASYPKLKFGFGGFVDEATTNELVDVFGSDEVLRVVGQPSAPATPAPTPKPQLVAETPAPAPAAPEPAPVAAEPAPEPTPAKTKGFGAKKAAAPATPAPAPAEPEPAPVAGDENLASKLDALMSQVGSDD